MQAPGKPSSAISPAAVRRARARGAAHFNAHAVLLDEVGTRLIEQLDYIKLQPARVLNLGCATGRLCTGLRARYANTEIVNVDCALALLQQARSAAAGPHLLCADALRLPLRARSFDLLVCNLGVYWCPIDQLLPELLRVAAPGALMLLSTFGPDTLQELRAAFKDSDQHQHVMSFIDMHDIGDALGQSGFAEPIMQMDRLTLTYADLPQLARELAALGLRNVLPGRPRALYAKSRWQTVRERYRRDAVGALPATFEIIYATAWKPLQMQRLPDGAQVIGFHPRKPG